MQRRKLVMRVGLAFALLCAPATVFAESIDVGPAVAIREIKITGDEEYVALQALRDITDLSAYWVGYESSETIDPSFIVPEQRLPAYQLRAGDAVLLTSDGALVCDAVATAKLSPSLGDTKGTLVIRELASSGIVSTFTTIDSVNWAKSTATKQTTAQLDIKLQSDGMVYPVWYHDTANPESSWRLGEKTQCSLALVAQENDEPESGQVIEWTIAAIEPLAIIEAPKVVGSTDSIVTTNRNVGLAPPLITEVLPNPTGTGTDKTGEFIELYNSNDKTFDLSSFILQTGTSSTHEWQIPVGTVIPSKSFKVFYPAESGLSLSNSGGAAALYDVAGKPVAQTDSYTTAADGQAWALASGAWYWTTKPTPGATNYIAAPIVKSAKKASSVTTKPKVAGTSTATASSTTPAQQESSALVADTENTPLVHPLVLAGVALLAVAYGVYEYRHDLANALHKLRRH